MSTKYLLPEMDVQDAAVEGNDGSKKGCWENVPDAYEYLLQHLILTYESTDSVFDGGSSGTPHIFEQLLIFNMAFFDADHPEHDRALAEWRAVLCIMSLRFVKNIPLRMFRIDLSEEQENPFLIAARTFMLNEEPVLLKTSWDVMYVLMLGDDPIAFTSPLTIMCPARMFKARIEKLNEWISIQKNAEKDFMNLDFSNSGNEYQAIARWLDALSADLFANGTDNPQILGKYESLINEIKSLRAICPESSSSRVTLEMKKDVYQDMLYQRKEYRFLNFCYDFVISNKRLEFLKGKYEQDILSQNLLLLSYDEIPGSIYNIENIEKLSILFQGVMRLDGRCITSVSEKNGSRMAMMAFLPFRQSFVEELARHDISPDELFETCEIAYDTVARTYRITVAVREFPYIFQKTYKSSDCMVIYAGDLPSVYMWPPKKIEGLNWVSYYVYYENEKNVDYSVPGEPEYVIRWEYTAKAGEEVPCRSFRIFQSQKFPYYICVTKGNFSGYLPISAAREAVCGVSGSAQLFLDMGHTTTAIALMKENPGGTFDLVPFKSLTSACIIKNERKAPSHFLPSDGQARPMKSNDLVPESQYFINWWDSFRQYDRKPENNSLSPLESGLPVFDSSFDDRVFSKPEGEFICISYPTMNERKRRKVHGYLEALLIFEIYEAVRMGCGRMQVNFLHSYSMSESELGEYINLFENAVGHAFAKTGIKPLKHGAYSCMDESDALLHSVYYQKNGEFSEDTLYTGIDIGWEKTLVVGIRKRKNGDQLVCNRSMIGVGGKEVGLLREDIRFVEYHKMLSVLLGEPYDGGPVYQDLLREFSNLCSGTRNKPNEYYHGLHSLIVKQIEEEDFQVSPDIYNRHREFRLFLKLLSMQILLLLAQAGLALGYESRTVPGGSVGGGAGKEDDGGAASGSALSEKNLTKIQIYLGGNGAKFLRWIMNLKKRIQIKEDNRKVLFILDVGDAVTKIFMEAYIIGLTGKADSGSKSTLTELEFFTNPKCQLLEGYILYQRQEESSRRPENDLWHQATGRGKDTSGDADQSIPEKELKDLLIKRIEPIFEEEADILSVVKRLRKTWSDGSKASSEEYISIEKAQNLIHRYGMDVTEKVIHMIDQSMDVTEDMNESYPAGE